MRRLDLTHDAHTGQTLMPGFHLWGSKSDVSRMNAPQARAAIARLRSRVRPARSRPAQIEWMNKPAAEQTDAQCTDASAQRRYRRVSACNASTPPPYRSRAHQRGMAARGGIWRGARPGIFRHKYNALGWRGLASERQLHGLADFESSVHREVLIRFHSKFTGATCFQHISTSRHPSTGWCRYNGTANQY